MFSPILFSFIGVLLFLTSTLSACQFHSHHILQLLEPLIVVNLITTVFSQPFGIQVKRSDVFKSYVPTSSETSVVETSAKPSHSSLNSRPIIGVLTQPQYSNRQLRKLHNTDFQRNASYLPASYVKSIESSGARVAVLLFNSTASTLRYQLSQLNGVLLPGGSASLQEVSPYREAVEVILGYVKMVNWKKSVKSTLGDDQGSIELDTSNPSSNGAFPLWAICLGFEALLVLTADQYKPQQLLTRVDAWDLPLPLRLTDFALDSPLFSVEEFGPIVNSILRDLTSPAVNATMHNHKWAVSIDTFTDVAELNENFDVLAVNEDRNSIVFVSLLQWKNASLPIYASQFHPEKSAYEWNSQQQTPHTYRAIRANRHFIDFFVQQARNNHNQLVEQDDNDNRVRLIYEFQPVWTHSEFEETYIFN